MSRDVSILFLLILITFSLLSADLHKAIREGELELVKSEFAKDPQAINRLDAEGVSPLHLACLLGKKEIVEWLLAAGIDVNTADRRIGLTPLFYAAQKGDVKLAKLLLQHGADPLAKDRAGKDITHWGVLAEDSESIKAILSCSRDLGLLLQAYEMRDFEEMEMLLKKGIGINSKNRESLSFLHTAAETGDTETGRWLIQHGADIRIRDKYGFTPLMTAAGNGRDEMVKLLLDKGAETRLNNHRGLTPLHLAASSLGSVGAVQLLLAAGADVNARFPGAPPPLLWAFQSNAPKQTLLLLLEAGADVREADEEGFTALHWAVKNDMTDMAEHLLKAGADINSRNQKGETPLLLSLSVSSGMFRFLIEKGADVDIADDYENTSLHLCVRAGKIEQVKLLLDHGACLLPNQAGKTPLDYAKESRNKELISLLKSNNR